MKNFSHIPGIIVSIFLVTACAYSEKQAFKMMRDTTTAAIQSENPALCKKLPQNLKYKAEGKGGELLEGYYGLRPRTGCLIEYYEKKFDLTVCELFYGLDDYEGDKCYTYFAEARSDVENCGKVRDFSIKAKCRALASLDETKCFEADKDEHDTSRYPRSVGFCIRDVVYRTKNYKACLKIDSSDYGDQWKVQRNECIWNAMYGTPSIYGGNVKTERWLCQYMVDDREWGNFKDCLAHEERGTSISVPPRW